MSSNRNQTLRHGFLIRGTRNGGPTMGISYLSHPLAWDVGESGGNVSWACNIDPLVSRTCFAEKPVSTQAICQEPKKVTCGDATVVAASHHSLACS
jgi:hypothetical protein